MGLDARGGGSAHHLPVAGSDCYQPGPRFDQRCYGILIYDQHQRSNVLFVAKPQRQSNADQLIGVFPLSAGGPIPVPANVLHPTNIARINVDNVLVSIYAGSMVRTPTIGVLAILRENLTTGEQSLHLYQTAQPVGALTILTAHSSVLTFSAPKENGTFSLGTNQFSLT